MSSRGSKKAPRRTAERILEAALELFNRFGEPNVSTTLISAELNISPGNLYYHYPAKDALINTLFDRYEQALCSLLRAADNVRNVEDAWLFFHMLFELVWQYRFLYRDLNDLLSKNRRLETHFQFVLKNKQLAVRAVLDGLGQGGAFGPKGLDAREAEPVATAMVVVVTYWLSYEYVSTTTMLVAVASTSRESMRTAPERLIPSRSARIARVLFFRTHWKCVSSRRFFDSRSLRSRYRKRYCQISSKSVCMKNHASSTLRTPSAAFRSSFSARS